MAKVDSYQKDLKLPMINIIPAIIWSIPVHQYLFPNAEFWVSFGIGAFFIIVYVTIGYLPYISLVTSIASTIMFTMLIWAPMDYIPNHIVRIIVKVIAAILIGLIELGLFSNATIPAWERRSQPF